MFAGHFGLAAGIKAINSGALSHPRASASVPSASHGDVPLWALMLSTQLLDVAFVFMVIAGIESFGGATGYGEGWIHAYYTHSLAGALLIAAIAGLISAKWWGRRGGLVIAATVFSHWLLDLLVHRPDLPVLPGNPGNLPLLGFGLWNVAAASIAVEALLVLGGGILYVVSVLARVDGAAAARPVRRGRALVAGGAMSALLVLALVTSVLGL